MSRAIFHFLKLLVFLAMGISASGAENGRRIVSREWCRFSLQTKVTDDEGHITGFRWNGMSRKTRTLWDEGGAVQRTEQATYDGLVQLTRIDPKNQLTTYEYGAVISSFDYSQSVTPYPSGYDNVGNLLKAVEQYGHASVNDRTVANTYDRTYRLDLETIAETGGSTTVTDYAYDDANNRIGKIVTVDGGTPTSWSFLHGTLADSYNSNQLKSSSDGTTTTTFLYDSNGNRSEKQVGGVTTQTYTWDHDNRLTQVLDSTLGTYTYSYDHRTRRVGRDESQAGGQSTELSFAGGLSVQEYTTGNGTPNVELIRGSDYGGGIGGVLYTIRSGAKSYNTYNSRGDVVSKTDDSAAITWQSSYEAFGTRTQEQGTTQDRQKANTKDEDPTGLLNENNRYRDLEFGVFITRDPAGFVDGPNVYTYVKQNPWTFFDPLGLKEQEIGEVYVEVNHKTKEFYVGQTGRTAEERMNDSKHSASKLRDKEGTLGYSRTVVADDGDNPGGLSARDQARARMAVERELHGDAKAKWGEQGYKSLNDEKQLLSDEKYEAEKRTTKPTLKAKEKPKVYESQKKTLGWGRKMKAVGSRAGITRGLALGGAGAILGVAAMYSDGDDTSLRMTAWASSPWANESLEHDLAQDIGGNLGTPGFLAVGKALQEARERAR